MRVVYTRFMSSPKDTIQVIVKVLRMRQKGVWKRRPGSSAFALTD
jgi:hypothetical protein